MFFFDLELHVRLSQHCYGHVKPIFVHILLPINDISSSWIVKVGRMTTKYFMINLHEYYLAKLGFKLATPWSAVRHAYCYLLHYGARLKVTNKILLVSQDTVYFLPLTLKLPITTTAVCFVICCHFCKQCGPRSDCSSRSSLIWVHTVCLYAKIGLKS